MQFFTYYRMNNYFAIVDLIVEIQIQNTYDRILRADSSI